MLSYFKLRSPTEKLRSLLDNIASIDKLLKALFDVNKQREFYELIDGNCQRIPRGFALQSWLEHGGKQYQPIIREFGIKLRIELENLKEVANFTKLIDRLVEQDRKHYLNGLFNFFKRYPSVLSLFQAYISGLLPVGNAFFANFFKEHKKLIDERPPIIYKYPKHVTLAPAPQLPKEFKPPRIPKEKIKTADADVTNQVMDNQEEKKKFQHRLMADFLTDVRVTLWYPESFIITIPRFLGFFPVRTAARDTATLALAKRTLGAEYFPWDKSEEELMKKIEELQIILNDRYFIDGFIPEKTIRDFYHNTALRCDTFTKLNLPSVIAGM